MAMATHARVWRTAPSDTDVADRLSRELEIPRPMAQVLAARGFSCPDEAGRFLDPRLSDLSDPFDMPGVRVAVDRLWIAVDGGERIGIYGDYDADGITGTALLVSVLRSVGGHVTSFLPSRHHDGYGFTPAALERCIAEGEPDLLVTADCGTNAHEAVAQATTAGIDVLVTDHHEISGEPVDAHAIVNPKLGEREETRHLAGVGVAFKLCHGFVKEGLRRSDPRLAALDLRDWLDIVAIGTVADIVPLLGENRTLVRHGLQRLNATQRPGLRSLMDVAGISGRIDCYHVGFVIGPRINAAGRMDSAEPALELLLTDDVARARELAALLDRRNRERKSTEDAVADEAAGEVDSRFVAERDFGIVVAREGWHLGTVGIVASRLVRRYNRPCVVIGFEDGEDDGRGSCRSVPGLDLMEVLAECADLLDSYGGHKAAAGLHLSKSCLREFGELFNAACATRLKGRDIRPVQTVDAWIGLQEADDRLFHALERMRPFGTGNPGPVWGAKGVCALGPPRVVGKDHLKMTLASGGTDLPAIGFGLGGREVPDGPMDVVFELRENTYRGHRSLQLHLKDLRPAGAE